MPDPAIAKILRRPFRRGRDDGIALARDHDDVERHLEPGLIEARKYLTGGYRLELGDRVVLVVALDPYSALPESLNGAV